MQTFGVKICEKCCCFISVGARRVGFAFALSAAKGVCFLVLDSDNGDQVDLKYLGLFGALCRTFSDTPGNMSPVVFLLRLIQNFTSISTLFLSLHHIQHKRSPLLSCKTPPPLLVVALQ